MRAIDLCDILERNYKKGEFQCNMDSCGNKPCDLCTVEKFENEIRTDERTKCIKELTEAMSKSPFTDDKVRVVKAWIAEQLKGGDNE